VLTAAELPVVEVHLVMCTAARRSVSTPMCPLSRRSSPGRPRRAMSSRCTTGRPAGAVTVPAVVRRVPVAVQGPGRWWRSSTQVHVDRRQPGPGARLARRFGYGTAAWFTLIGGPCWRRLGAGHRAARGPGVAVPANPLLLGAAWCLRGSGQPLYAALVAVFCLVVLVPVQPRGYWVYARATNCRSIASQHVRVSRLVRHSASRRAGCDDVALESLAITRGRGPPAHRTGSGVAAGDVR
jgi:hypothetical protein